MMFYYKTHCKIIVYAPGHVFPFVLSLPLSLWCCIIVGEQVLPSQLPYSWKHKEKKNFTPSMTPPSPRLIFPLLSPIKSLNDSHASDTPPSFGFVFFLFFYCLYQTASKGNTQACLQIQLVWSPEANERTLGDFFYILEHLKLVIIHSKWFKIY